MRVRFGPAGAPINYKGKTEEIPRYLRVEEGLDAFEYQAVRSIRISQEKATKLGEIAREYDVQLSLHAPYAINLAALNEEKKKASISRLVRSMQTAYWMKAKIVVFHPGYYLKRSPEEALREVINCLKKIVEECESLGIKGVYLGPELTGKKSQVGSLSEIINICKAIDIARPVIDWAHLHAREGGCLNTKEDYLRVLDTIERELGSDIVKGLHCHFTRVEFTEKGERKHHTLDETDYGPDFEPLAEIIVENGYSFTIISETPLLDLDAIKMKQIYLRIKERYGRKNVS